MRIRTATAFLLAAAIAPCADLPAVFAQRCVACHGARLQSGGVRLDSSEGAARVAARAAELATQGKMPPSGPKLTIEEASTIRAWAAQVRPKHWAFEPLVSTAQPMRGTDTEAPRARLLRRISLDLVGLPPEADDGAPYEKLVDKLLASPHFGEKWARHWLDLARYADSDGYEQDQPRPHAWRYRDWVIDSLNRNKPFDQFTLEQIAGDLLEDATLEQKTGTGFHRNTLTSREGGIDLEQLRTDQVADRASTVATVWLGLTMECARCHDHKYDPIPQRDFYRFYAFFNSADEVNLDAPVPEEVERYRQRRPEYERKYAEIVLSCRVPELLPLWEVEILRAMANPSERLEWTQVLDYVAVFQDHCHDILRTPPARRTPRQQHDLTRVFLKYPGPLGSWPQARSVKFSEGYGKLEALDAAYPALSEAPVLRERAVRRATHGLERGDFRSPGAAVAPGTPAFLPGAAGNRLELARWLTSKANPLTARVFVNRVWQELFGEGLVAASEDFGLRTEPPIRRDLLDWLAADFRDHNWNIKRLIRTVVLLPEYRSASQRRLRLPAELIRDSALAASGLLDGRVGGRSVRPPMPKGLMQVAYRSRAWEESTGADRYRRGLYTFFWRSVPHPQLVNFDAPSSLTACSRRNRSTTPLQALNLLNDPVFWEAAEVLGRQMAVHGLEWGFERCLGRRAKPAEIDVLKTLLGRRGDYAAAASVLLNLDEFITRE